MSGYRGRTELHKWFWLWGVHALTWGRLGLCQPERLLLQPHILGNKLTQKDNANSEVQFITPAGPRQSPVSQGCGMTFVKTLYTLSVLLKHTSPDSLNLAWKVLKGDTIRLQPWFIIGRIRWLYIVAYTNGCHKDYKSDWLHRGLSHSFWLREILVWNLVFISLGGQFGHMYVIPMATRHVSKAHWKCKMEFPSFSRWSQLGLSLFSLVPRE